MMPYHLRHVHGDASTVLISRPSHCSSVGLFRYISALNPLTALHAFLSVVPFLIYSLSFFVRLHCIALHSHTFIDPGLVSKRIVCQGILPAVALVILLVPCTHFPILHDDISVCYFPFRQKIIVRQYTKLSTLSLILCLFPQYHTTPLPSSVVPPSLITLCISHHSIYNFFLCLICFTPRAQCSITAANIAFHRAHPNPISKC